MDLEKIWRSVLAEIQVSVSKATYQTHFSHTKLISLNEGVASIGVPNPLIRGFIENRYYALVKSSLDHQTKLNTSLVFTLVASKNQISAKDAGPLFNQMVSAPENTEDMGQVTRRAHIRPELTFDNFAVSTTNQMAYAAATAVSKAPGAAYNPLFLYGGVGVGKTHLMHAIANVLLNKRPNLRVVYCMGDEFLNEIIESIQTKSSRQFKQKYRGAQLFLVDDVQFIAGKTTAQEEFFHTFNAIHREGGQIVLTSDRSPSEIARLEDRLRSRFEGGLTVDISPPNFELRAAIVNIKSQSLGFSLNPDAAQLIAANITDTRALEGFLRRLMSEVSTKGVVPNAATVAALLKLKSIPGEVVNQNKTRLSAAQILDIVAQHFDLKATALKGEKRDRPIARPRQLFMYLCRTELGLTLSDIGGALGGRDHTTIMHGVDKITQELSTNDHLRQDLEGIKKKLWV